MGVITTYEIAFTGQAGTTLRAESGNCQVSVRPGTTTFRAELPDQGVGGARPDRTTPNPDSGRHRPCGVRDVKRNLRQARCVQMPKLQ